MSDPYRDQAAIKLQALLDEERALLVRAGKAMIAAGVLAILAVLVGLPMTLASAWFGWIADSIPLVLGIITLQAGLVLARMPGGSRDYGHIETSMASLRVVYTVKGVIMLLAVGVACLAFVSPMFLRMLL
jgi:hypothetical protein